VSAPLPSRPRLGDHVLARRHWVGGDERVVLHDLRSGRLVQLGPREWSLLAEADGTRDLPGIVLAAARAGAFAREPALRAFLEQLHEAGLLAGEAAPEPADDAARDAPPPDRPLALLPDFSLHCDGRGSCCRLYASVLFSPVETARARALQPKTLDGGADPSRVFLPERGSAPCAGSAVAQIDGRCAYLGEADRCALHRAGGPEAKPLGCTLFPASFLDDGERIRVSAWIECACVLASVGRPGGAPLLDSRARTRADLDPAVHVERLPERVLVRDGDHAGAATLRRFTDQLLACPSPPDVPRALVQLARTLEAEGLAEQPDARFDPHAPPLAPAELLPWIDALHRRAERRAREDAVWRSERDLARLATRAIAAATRALLDPDALAALLAAPAPAPASEAFSLRASLHAFRFVGELPLASALRDQALRLLVARALPGAFAALAVPDPAFEHPLALLEAMMRGHGLSAYAHDLR
jgi:lysine-N-methylase